MRDGKVKYMDLGCVEYGECWDLQRGLFDELVRAKGSAPSEVPSTARPTLILCEHPHVYTLGKSGREGNMLADEARLKSIGAHFVKIDRGGDVTYHGPGQLVGYPILDIEALGLGLKEYIARLEDAIIATVGHYGIEAGRSEGATGVWLEPDAKGGLRKIAAIGVRSSRYVTMHGFALNITTDMRYFDHINPCGFTDRGVTSLEREIGRKVDMGEVKEIFKREFAAVFGVALTA